MFYSRTLFPIAVVAALESKYNPPPPAEQGEEEPPAAETAEVAEGEGADKLAEEAPADGNAAEHPAATEVKPVELPDISAYLVANEEEPAHDLLKAYRTAEAVEKVWTSLLTDTICNAHVSALSLYELPMPGVVLNLFETLAVLLGVSDAYYKDASGTVTWAVIVKVCICYMMCLYMNV